jgi:hypothetical protein
MTSADASANPAITKRAVMATADSAASRAEAWAPQTSGGYGGSSGYGQGGQRGGQPNYGQPSYGREAGSSGTSSYGRSDYGSRSHGGIGESNYGSGRYEAGEAQSWRGYGGGYGGDQGFENAGSWFEPYGEGQQYGSQRGSGGGFGQRESGRLPFGQSGQMGQFGQYGQSGQYQSGQFGQHRGKGPKGYQRTDDRLKELICERLRDDPEIDPSEVTINVSGSRVTLDGSVDSRRTKHAIEDIVEQFDVSDVQNNLRVTRQSAQSGQGSQSEWGKSATGGRTATGNDDNESSTKQKKN